MTIYRSNLNYAIKRQSLATAAVKIDGFPRLLLQARKPAAPVQPHWFAIAEAIPSKVLDRNFHRSALGGSFQIRCSLPSTISVGVVTVKSFDGFYAIIFHLPDPSYFSAFNKLLT
jgi:hypothetical protein